jgi:hypothetical protein
MAEQSSRLKSESSGLRRIEFRPRPVLKAGSGTANKHRDPGALHRQRKRDQKNRSTGLAVKGH